MPPKLTETRLKILRLTARLGCPSAAQLATELGITRQGLHDHLQALRALGLLESAERRYDPVRLTEQGRELVGDGGYPVVGRIAAGVPVLAEQDIQRSISRIEDALPLIEGDFFLEVAGDSMIGAGIHPGNLVAIRPADQVQDGEIAAVVVPGENTATLKRVYRQGKDALLVSDNPEYPPMRFPADAIRVQGLYLGHIALTSRKRSPGS